jgi:hypothetical protein
VGECSIEVGVLECLSSYVPRTYGVTVDKLPKHLGGQDKGAFPDHGGRSDWKCRRSVRSIAVISSVACEVSFCATLSKSR